jgi:hypothetical protein
MQRRQTTRAHAKSSPNLLWFAFAGAIACSILVMGVFYFSARTLDAPPTRTPEAKAPVQLADATPAVRSVPIAPAVPTATGDQRIAAARGLVEDRAAGTAEEPGENERSQPKKEAQANEPAPQATPGAGRDDAESNDPRSLLRRARRQFKSGQPKAALETSKQIALTIDDEKSRQKIEDKIRNAERSHGPGQTVDFDSLIQLIEQTIAPNTWTTVGGAGSVTSFAGGVYVDTGGLIRLRDKPSSEALADVRNSVRSGGSAGEPREPGSLRKVSLPRLEAEAARRFAAGEALTDEMRYLAGLQEVRYVLVYPDEHDIVLVGPADDWALDEFGRAVGQHSHRPVLQLDDLVVILRACFGDSENHGLFGCGIYPRQERLQQVQEFLARSAAAGPIEPSQRDRWLAELRNQLGEQDIEVFGIHPGSRVAHVMVEADYRMKLIGNGLQPAGVPGIPSYFDLIGQPDDARLNRPIDTLRWWFALNYDSIVASDARDAFELHGGRVQVLSENELLTATGQRVHTGQSEAVNAQFARNFTDHFSELSAHDPNFADLAGIFDLAVVAGLLRTYGLPSSAGWNMTTLMDPDDWVVSLNPPPRTVETVMNHRVYRGRHIVAAISGGVHVNPWSAVSADRLRADGDGSVKRARSDAKAPNASARSWWWD